MGVSINTQSALMPSCLFRWCAAMGLGPGERPPETVWDKSTLCLDKPGEVGVRVSPQEIFYGTLLSQMRCRKNT